MVETDQSKTNTMKISKLFTIALVSAGLAFGVAAQAGGKKHEEENISSSDVPQAVQTAADKHLKGASVVRWEKEGANYEAVVNKDGKEWGYRFDANGKLVSKHAESAEKEKTEKGEKY
jgi:YD repeat-containing protein